MDAVAQSIFSLQILLRVCEQKPKTPSHRVDVLTPFKRIAAERIKHCLAVEFGLAQCVAEISDSGDLILRGGAVERKFFAVGKAESRQRNSVRQLFRDQSPTVQRGEFQILPFLEYVIARLELQRVRVTAADGVGLRLDFVCLIADQTR